MSAGSLFTPASVAGGVERTEVAGHREGVYWLEHSFDQGRSRVMHAPSGGAAGAARAMTPSDIDVGTLAWEYGGGHYLVCGGAVVYSDRGDQRLYRVAPGGVPVAVTPAPSVVRGERYADGCAAPDGRWAAYVRESHAPGEAVRHELVAVDLGAGGAGGGRPPRPLTRGRDFYMAPRISPDGRRLAWIAWSKPQMPWDGSELWVADVGDDRTLSGARLIAGSATESVLQPAWSPDGTLHWVSDRSGWWNLYALGDGGPRAVSPEEAEYSGPSWQYGRRSYGFLDDRTIVAVRIRGAVHELVAIDPRAGRARPLEPRFTSFAGPHLSCHGSTVAFIAATPSAGAQVRTLDLGTGRGVAVTDDEPPAGADAIPVATAITFPGRDGSDVYGFWHPAAGVATAAPPPLILHLHGGPTDSARLAFDAEFALWTSRGFALLDLNYSGSTGFGSAYRHRLDGEWGARDLEDSLAAVAHLISDGRVDPARVFVRGASAGGYLTLRCVTASTAFAGGMARCGIADLALWREDTHDFESRYTDLLVGPASATDLYAQRSPARHVGARAAPLLLVHGLVDTVVPPAHARLMASAYEAAGRPHTLALLPDEPHGLRRASSRERWLAAELAFVAGAIGSSPGDG